MLFVPSRLRVCSAENKPVQFAGIKVLEIVINVALNMFSFSSFAEKLMKRSPMSF
jgi:hypothetical protein